MPLLANSPVEVSTVSFDSYSNYQFWIQNEEFSGRRGYEGELTQQLIASKDRYLLIPGLCAYCQKTSHFLFDSFNASLDSSGNLIEPNWRERLICSRCNLNNRNRFIWIFLNNFPVDANTWLVDQGSSMLPTLVSRFERINHKETKSLLKNDNEVGLAGFDSNKFRLHLSLETMNIVDDLMEYLYQSFRTLIPNGRFVATFPFNREQQFSQLSDQKIRIFGWDVIGKLRDVGFVDVQFVSGWSKEYVHLGPEQFFLYATKY